MLKTVSQNALIALSMVVALGVALPGTAEAQPRRERADTFAPSLSVAPPNVVTGLLARYRSSLYQWWEGFVARADRSPRLAGSKTVTLDPVPPQDTSSESKTDAGSAFDPNGS